MFDSEIAYHDLIDNMHDGLYFTGRDLIVTYWNKSAERISGYQSSEIVGKTTCEKILAQSQEAIEHIVNNGRSASTIVQEHPEETEVFLSRKDGNQIPVIVRTYPLIDCEGQIVGAAQTFADNSSKTTLMKQLEEMKQAAMLDHLTSLPNRRYCDIALSAKLSELKRYNWMFGLVMADIDFFKRVNDTHGHHIGDRVLKSVSRALVENSRPFDVVSRWGGEEFLIVIPHVDADSLRNLTDRFRVIVEQTPIPTENGEVKVTISLGATLAQPSDTIQSLIERVDRLMYQSKDEGRNTSTFRSS